MLTTKLNRLEVSEEHDCEENMRSVDEILQPVSQSAQLWGHLLHCYGVLQYSSTPVQVFVLGITVSPKWTADFESRDTLLQ